MYKSDFIGGWMVGAASAGEGTGARPECLSVQEFDLPLELEQMGVSYKERVFPSVQICYMAS